MRKLLLSLLLAVSAWAQIPVVSRTETFTAAAAGTTFTNIGGRALYYRINYFPIGAPAACTVAVDTSLDGSSWSAGNAIAGQTCTSPGTFTTTTQAVYNYVRVNVTALSANKSVTVNISGYETSPTAASAAASFINVMAYGAVGNGTTNDYAAILAAQAAATSTGACVFFPAHTYAYATALVITDDKTCWNFEPGGSLKYTGAATANAFTFDGTGATNGKQAYLTNLRVNANGLATTAAIYFKKLIGGESYNLSATNTSGIGIRCSWCVLHTFVNPTVSHNLEPFTTVPTVGLQMDDTAGAGTYSSANTIINPRMEGITTGTGYGILEKSQANTYSGGTSESNDVGIWMTSTAQQNTVINMFFEGNATQDGLVDGFLNHFIGNIGTTAIANSFQFGATSYLNTFKASTADRITVTAGAAANSFDDAFTQNGITDGGTNTSIRRVWKNAPGVYEAEKNPVTFIADNFSTSGMYTAPAGVVPTLAAPSGNLDVNISATGSGGVIMGQGNATYPNAYIVFNRLNNTARSYAIDFRTAGAQKWIFGNAALSDETMRMYNIATGTNQQIWQVDGTTTFGDRITAPLYGTTTNCADSAGAAACGSASAGAFVIDAASTSTVVSTTAVTANSQIFLQEDSSLGARLGITCNTQSILLLGAPVITARTAGASFTATIVVGPTATPMCINFRILN